MAENELLPQINDPEANVFGDWGRRTTYSGPSFESIAHGVISGIQQWADTPRRAYVEGISPEEATNWGPQTAMMGLGGTSARALFSPRPAGNQLGMFIGPKAQGGMWDARAAQEAARMEAAGVPKEQIFKDTMTMRGPEGKLRQEIADPAQVKESRPELENKLALAREHDLFDPETLDAMQHSIDSAPRGTFGEHGGYAFDIDRARLEKARQVLGPGAPHSDIERYAESVLGPSKEFGVEAQDWLRHPDFWKAYPEAATAMTKYDPQRAGAAMNTKPDPVFRGQNQYEIALGGNLAPELSALNPLTGAPVMGHELQHIVQGIEGFSLGGNPRYAFDKPYKMLNDQYYDLIGKLDQIPLNDRKGLAKATEDLDAVKKKLDIAKANKDSIGFNLYRRFGGEVESNLTQNRWGLTLPQRRARTPWQDMDYPTEKQIP